MSKFECENDSTILELEIVYTHPSRLLGHKQISLKSVKIWDFYRDFELKTIPTYLSYEKILSQKITHSVLVMKSWYSRK